MVLTRVQLFVTPWSVARKAPLSMGFCCQEYWSGVPFPPPGELPIYINYTTKLRQKVDMQKDNYKVMCISSVQSELSVRLFSQSLSRVRLFATPWTTALQASLFITNSQNLLKLMSIASVMPSNHLILCRPLLLPSIFPSIRVFSNG